MSLAAHELRLFLRQRIAVPALVLLAVLSAASVWNGLSETRHQREIIERIQPKQAEDVAAVADFVTLGGDPGYAAYYTFHATWDAPSRLAFAALGQRDVAPYMLRVNALALESQIHNNENYNAELALPGKFDWAFVLTYVAPLVLIALLHDLKSSEREARRLDVLRAMARRPWQIWGTRVALRSILPFLAVILPFLAGAWTVQAPPIDVAAALGLAALYFGFWVVVALLISRLEWKSATNAAGFAAIWFGIVLVIPALAHLAINAAIPVRQGVELTLAQREMVHAGWDKPKEETMAAFARLHPEWRDTPPVEGGFHWKWYYAFQHLGDVSVQKQSAAYREGLESREAWTRRIGYLLPPVALQVALHRIAETDLSAQLAYQDRIRGFHTRLREFYYPYIFEERSFTREDFANAPKWD